MKKIFFIFLFSGFVFCANAQNYNPYKNSPALEISLIATGVTLNTISFFFRNNLSPLNMTTLSNIDNNRQAIILFDRFCTKMWSPSASLSSDLLVASSFLFPSSLLLFPNIRKNWFSFLLIFSESIIISNGIVQLVKYTAKRNRPFVYNEKVSLEEKLKKDARVSFFSAHTTNAFCNAILFSQIFSDYFPNSKFKPYIWSGSIFFASLVASLRIVAGKHFTTDVIAGALVGSGIGLLVPYLHRYCKKNHLEINLAYSSDYRRIGLTLYY